MKNFDEKAKIVVVSRQIYYVCRKKHNLIHTYTMLAQWWASLDAGMKVLWCMTLAASFIFIIQSIMTFIGADSDSPIDSAGIDATGVDADAAGGNLDGDLGSNLLTFRNLVNFVIGFGWTVILLRESIASTPLLVICGIVAGALLVVLVMLLFKWLSGMQQTGTINLYKSALNCTGSVYLTIPGRRQGEGKVQISINESIREYTAQTDGETLKTGTLIKVVEVLDPHTVLVEEQTSIII